MSTIKIIKRDSSLEDFDNRHIYNAVIKALNASHESKNITEDAERVTQLVSKNITQNMDVEKVQDLVEEALMDQGFYHTAKKYILYRNDRAKVRNKVSSHELSKLVKESAKYFNNDPMRQFVYYRTYARWIPDKNRREVWIETVDRYVNFMIEKLGSKLTNDEYAEIKMSILRQEVMPSMRLLQFAGNAAKRCNVCVYNCAYTAPQSLRDIVEIMYISMSGTGVGFSVEAKYVDKLPLVKRQKIPPVVHRCVVEDSKEGWCDGFLFALEKWFDGDDVSMDYSKLRPAGARLKTMGGRSSGPQALIDLIDFTRRIVFSKQECKLSPLNVYDIICKIGEIVVSGGVRRSALISLSDFSDTEIRDAKKGMFWNTNPQRSMTNNSVAYNEKPSMIDFMEEWLALAKNQTGERGIFNRGGLAKVLPDRRLNVLGDSTHDLGCNPCVSEDTWVQTVEGPQQVKDLVGKKIDLIVNGQKREMLSDGFFLTGNKLLYLLKTKRGYSVKLTDNHPILLNKDGKDQWTEVKDVKIGDTLLLSQHSNLYRWKGEGTFDDGSSCLTDNISMIEKKSCEFYEGFLYGLVRNKGVITNNTIYISYGSDEFKYGVQRMLSRLGVLCSVEGDQLVIPLKNYTKSFFVREKEVDFATLNQYVEFYTDTIESITQLDYQNVYDVTVNDVHEFCGNGIRLHNCAEIVLQPKQMCNLSEVVCRSDDTEESLLRKIRVATMIGTYQATLTDYKYLSPEWKKNQENERLLGVSLTGQWDCPALRNEETLKKLKEYAVEVNKMYASRFGINQSTCVTTTKPSGCSKKETLLVSNNGILTLEEIGDINGSQWQDHDIEIATHSDKQQSTKYYVNGKAKTKIIHMESGLILESTFNHQYKIFDPNSAALVWKRSDELKDGDILPYSLGDYSKFNITQEIELITVNTPYHNVRKIKQPSTLNANLAWLLGLYNGDGSNHKKGIRIAGCLNDVNILEKAKQIALEQFGIEGKIYTRTKGENNADLYLNSTYLLSWLGANNLLKKESHEIFIPVQIRKSPIEVIASYIDGYWQADGSLDKNGLRTWVTVSWTMAEQLVVTLRAIGQDVSVRLMPPTKTSWGNRMRYWINEKKGRSGDYKRRVDNQVFDQLNDAGLSHLTPDYVKFIEDGECDTFDIEVPNGNEYLANSYISHNTVSQMVDCASGIHPRFDKYYIRRIRVAATDPLFKLMKDQGYPYNPEVGQNEDTATSFVLDFPVKAPDNAIFVKDVDALQQLEYWKKVKTCYTEHNPSITVYIDKDDWFKVGQWVYENWDYVCGLSFLPRSDHIYRLAPYEKITRDQYEDLSSKIPMVDFSKIVYYESDDGNVDLKREYACVGDKCEL